MSFIDARMVFDTDGKRVSEKIGKLGQDLGSVNTQIGDLSGLQTSNKNNVVGAVNSLNSQLAQNVQRFEINNKTIRTQYDPNSCVLFQFDDAHEEDYTIAWKQIFEPEGVPFSLAAITDKVGTSGYFNYLSWEQLKELKDAGNTVASHTHTHTDASY